MRIQLVDILDRGTPNKERVHLRATADADLSFYVVLATTYQSPTSVSTTPRMVFWFPAKAVKAGDTVLIASGFGTPSERKNKDLTTTHFYYMNSRSPLWSKTGESATLFELDSWQTSRYQ